MAVDYEFRFLHGGVVEGKFFSRQGKSVCFHVVDSEEFPYTMRKTTPASPLLQAVDPTDEWAGTLSTHEKHKKSGWPLFQDRIRKLTGWKIGILDIDRMVVQCGIWKLHNL